MEKESTKDITRHCQRRRGSRECGVEEQKRRIPRMDEGLLKKL